MSRKRTLFLFTCIFAASTASFLSCEDDNWPNGGGDDTSSDDSKGDSDTTDSDTTDSK